MQPFFFYGTLWTGTASPRMNALVRRHCRPLGSAFFHGRLYDLGAYPAAVRGDDGADRVMGMLYELRHPERWLAELDRYESFDPNDTASSEYVRVLIPVVRNADGQTVDAWVYLYNRRANLRRRIPHGDYSRHSAAR
jgi:gamma-glutamylcyclotransferase (GGCT)/AIG2-like uncharacterized protein YtfP